MKRPEWLRKTVMPKDPREMQDFLAMEKCMKNAKLHTVCKSASCPNRGECYSLNTATIMILGDICTRACRFCGVKTGRPGIPDNEEPRNAAKTISELGLEYAVITSVTRDDLEDGGAQHFAETIRHVKEENPGLVLEVLVPDFVHSVHYVAAARPDVISHNVETVPRLYSKVRDRRASYKRSLELLSTVKCLNINSKSGLMVGLGETPEEVIQVMEDLRSIDCDCLTIGQYLQPSSRHLKVAEYVHPDIFEKYKNEAERLGFMHVESGPYVRSSFHASEFLRKIKK